MKKQKTEEAVESIEMPNVIGMSIEEAKKSLKNLGLEVEINGEGDTVIDQLPKKGIQINEGTEVMIYIQ